MVLPCRRTSRKGVRVRAIGLDVHRDFCEIAIAEDGKVRSAGRIATRPEVLELFAASLTTDDRVALEVTGNAWEIARIIEPHVARVIVVSPSDTGIRQARAKTDRLDARTLARLLAAGSLDSVWMPDERTRVMRRRLARRAQLVSARTRVKNEIHAILIRRLKGRPDASDLFGKKGRAWLAELELPIEERETLRERSAADRFPRRRDRLGRPRDRARCAQLARGAPADDRPRREPDRCRQLPGGRRRHPSLPRPAQAGRLPRTGPHGPPVRGRARHTRPHLKARRRSGAGRARRGQLERRPQPRPVACLLPAHPRPPRPPDRDHRRRAQARVPVLGAALAPTGLRLRPALADRQEAPAPGDSLPAHRAGKTAAASGSPTASSETPNSTSPDKPSTPTPRPSATAKPPGRSKRARARHRGAHHKSPRRAKPRGRPQAPDVCASLRQSLAPTRTIPQEATASNPHLTFIRRYVPGSASRPSAWSTAGGNCSRGIRNSMPCNRRPGQT